MDERLVLFRHRGVIVTLVLKKSMFFCIYRMRPTDWKSPSQPLHYTTVRFMFG
jgi:hypothetical protein